MSEQLQQFVDFDTDDLAPKEAAVRVDKKFYILTEVPHPAASKYRLAWTKGAKVDGKGGLEITNPEAASAADRELLASSMFEAEQQGDGSVTRVTDGKGQPKKVSSLSFLTWRSAMFDKVWKEFQKLNPSLFDILPEQRLKQLNDVLAALKLNDEDRERIHAEVVALTKAVDQEVLPKD